MSVLDIINIHPANLNSSGRGGVRTLTKEDVLSAIPDTVFGNVLVSFVMQDMPRLKSQIAIKSECIKLYNRLRRRNEVKQLDPVDINRIIQIAIKSVHINKTITTRQLAEKLCETHTKSYYKHYPVYEKFYYMIQDEINKVKQQTKNNLTCKQN